MSCSRGQQQRPPHYRDVCNHPAPSPGLMQKGNLVQTPLYAVAGCRVTPMVSPGAPAAVTGNSHPSAAGTAEPGHKHCVCSRVGAACHKSLLQAQQRCVLAQERLLPTEEGFGDNLKSFWSWDLSPASNLLAGKVLSLAWRFLCCLTRACRG